MDSLASWAMSQGAIFDSSRIRLTKISNQEIANSTTADTDDWTLTLVENSNNATLNTTTTTTTTTTNTVVKVPSHLVMSSETLRQKFKETAMASSLQEIEALLSKRNAQDQIPQFYLFLHLLSEYYRDKDSPWYPWIQALPKRCDTAICMDEVELECLPPFAWALAKVERYNFEMFRQALSMLRVSPDNNDTFPIVVDDDDDDAADTDLLLHWIFNTVFTRCWRYPELLPNGRERCDIVPLGDMFNHNAEPTVDIDYDGDGKIEFSLQQQQQPSNLDEKPPVAAISYGLSTNPYRFLVIFGFVDETQPEVFCQLVAKNPSQQLVDMGYDANQMVFRTSDGAISNAVWHVILYQLLEQAPELQNLLHQAHINNQTHVTQSLHAQYHRETCTLLLRHVEKSLQEFQILLKNANRHSDQDRPRLELIRRHLRFMANTFEKVRRNLTARLEQETQAF
jgi:hypothetical protein